MSQHFKRIGLIGKPHHEGANQTLTSLYQFLSRQGCEIVVEEQVADRLPFTDVDSMDLLSLGQSCDLAIVVGGDGNMLGAARVLSRFDVAVVGVNRGNLGFLTDLNPDDFEQPLGELLAGQYHTESRFLLNAEVYRHGKLKSSNSAVNEAVLHPGKVAHMIDFELLVDDEYVYHQRSDGLIVATPTGSTAYSLSGGGPIVNPSLNALCLVPMFPHTLSSRPIVIDANSVITMKISKSNDEALMVSCDGHVTLSVLPGDDVVIRKCEHQLKMIHPRSYNYYEVLRSKLRWGHKLF